VEEAELALRTEQDDEVEEAELALRTEQDDEVEEVELALRTEQDDEVEEAELALRTEKDHVVDEAEPEVQSECQFPPQPEPSKQERPMQPTSEEKSQRARNGQPLAKGQKQLRKQQQQQLQQQQEQKQQQQPQQHQEDRGHGAQHGGAPHGDDAGAHVGWYPFALVCKLKRMAAWLFAVYREGARAKLGGLSIILLRLQAEAPRVVAAPPRGSSIGVGKRGRATDLQQKRRSGGVSVPSADGRLARSAAVLAGKGQGWLAWRALLFGHPVILSVSAVMFACVIFGKFDKLGNPLGRGRARRLSDEEVCIDGGPQYIEKVDVAPDSCDYKPRVSLEAPCVYKTYQKVARKYRMSMAGWYFIQNPMVEKLEIKHRYEDPILYSKGSLRKTNETIITFFQDNIMPLYGIMNDETYSWYVGAGYGIIWHVFDTNNFSDLERQQLRTRPVMEELATKLRNNFFVTYMGTHNERDWIESELGVSSYPAIVVQKRLLGTMFEYTGPVAVAPLQLFAQDAFDGCFDFGADTMSGRAFGVEPKGMCDVPTERAPTLEDLYPFLQHH